MSDEQDMRKMGGLKNLLPFTYAIMLIGSLALIGFPFLAGFYSKDVILEVSASTYTAVGQFAFVLGILAAFCTAFYSTRLLYLVFLANPNGNKNVTLHAHEGSWRMTLPLFLLSIFSVTVGYLSKDMFIGFGTNFWGTSIFINPVNYTMTDIEFLDIQYKLLPLIVGILGVYLAYFVYTYKLNDYYTFKKSSFAKNIFNFFNKKWYFDRIYNEHFVQNILSTSYHYFYQSIDRGLVEKVGPSGISVGIVKFVETLKVYQTGFMLHYLVYFFVSIILFVVLSTKDSLLIFTLLLTYLYLLPNIIKNDK